MKARYSTIALVAVPVPSPIIEAELPFTFTDFSPFLFHCSRNSVRAGFRTWAGEIGGNFERELNNRADLRVICDRHLFCETSAECSGNAQLDGLLRCIAVFRLSPLPIFRRRNVVAKRAVLADTRKGAELRRLSIQRPQVPRQEARLVDPESLVRVATHPTFAVGDEHSAAMAYVFRIGARLKFNQT